MRNAGLDEAQAGGKNINNLRYADDTTLMAESEEELKSLMMKAKRIPKTKIVASGLITPWKIDGGKMGTVTDFIFLGSKITVDSDYSHEIKRRLLLGKKLCQTQTAFKKQRHHVANKGPSSQSYGFTSSHGWMSELDHKEG